MPRFLLHCIIGYLMASLLSGSLLALMIGLDHWRSRPAGRSLSEPLKPREAE